MKKLLAPLFGLAAIGAIAGPMVSCGSGGGGGGGGGGGQTTTTISLNKTTAGAYATYSTYSVSSSKTYKYTGVCADSMLGTTPTTMAIATTNGSQLTGLTISSVKVNGSYCSSIGSYITYQLPSGISYGSSLSIEVVYSTSASDCITAITLA